MSHDAKLSAVDPDIDLRVDRLRGDVRPPGWDVTAAVAVGGALGAVGRYALSVALPSEPGSFGWATFVTNVSGCLLIGAVMVLLSESPGRAHDLARLFLGAGVLGGFTTFSTYTVETERLLASGLLGLAFAYLFGTLMAALIAVRLGIVTTRGFIRRAQRRERGRR